MARTFAANRDIKIEASESSAGAFTLRTRGLAAKRRAELEIADVPEALLNGAGGVINLVADYSVNSAELLADQTVGIVLAVGDEGRKLLLAARAVTAEAPKAGLWSKLTGGGKGVLRLVDVTGDSGAPLTAITSMLVHRAELRAAKDDAAGAREELETAVAAFPGQPGGAEAPAIGGADGTYNWQNHLAYLDLARLDEDDAPDAAAARFGEALARSAELARRELGASLDDVLGLDDDEIASAARRIIEHNLGAMHRGDADAEAPDLATVASPIWELDEGRSSRRASVIPAALLALYYEGKSKEGLVREGAELVTKILARDRAEPWHPAWIARSTRQFWITSDAPLLEPIGPARPSYGLVSLVLADIARCFQAGATAAEILARYERQGGEPSDELVALAAKLDAHGAWEGEMTMKAMDL